MSIIPYMLVDAFFIIWTRLSYMNSVNAPEQLVKCLTWGSAQEIFYGVLPTIQLSQNSLENMTEEVWLRVLKMPCLNHTLHLCQHKNASPCLFISNPTHSLTDGHELWAIHMSVEIISLLSSISDWNLCLSLTYEHEQQIQ